MSCWNTIKIYCILKTADKIKRCLFKESVFIIAFSIKAIELALQYPMQKKIFLLEDNYLLSESVKEFDLLKI